MRDNSDGIISKIEDKIEKLDGRISNVESRVNILDFQVGRLTSHVESEIGLARKDLARLEEKLFGEDDNTESGRIGELIKNQKVINEQINNILLKFAYGAGFTACIVVLVEFYKLFK